MNEYQKKYNTDGYLILKNIVPQSYMTEFASQIESYIEFLLKQTGVTYDPRDLPHSGFAQLDRIRRENRLGVDYIKKLYVLVQHSTALYQIISYAPLLDIIKSILGLDKNSMLYQWQHPCRMDSYEFQNFLWPWHQESVVAPDAEAVHLWMPAIGRNHLVNGSITVLKGSHIEGELKCYELERIDGYIVHKISDVEMEIRKQRYENVVIDISPGDVLLFHHNLMHTSNLNKSKKVRYSIICNYVNPYDEKFEIIDEVELIKKGRGSKCVNAADFVEYRDYQKLK